MPCYDPQPSNDRSYENDQLKKDKKYLEAALCALMTELHKHPSCNNILVDASRNGKIDLFQFWKQHHNEDIKRIEGDMLKYSDHEIEIIKSFLNK